MSKRETYAIELRSVPSDRFQPTGFPDLGAAKFQKPVGDSGWVDAILVESSQSMANRFEAVGWNSADNRPVETLTRLPWVQVIADDDGRYMTSSRTEAHRLASAFVRKSKTDDGVDMITMIRERFELKDDTPLSYSLIAGEIFKLDPLCLLHGVFFSLDSKQWPGQPKIARALTGFIEATDVREAYSGGVKRDDVRHSIREGVGGSSEGYGHVPYPRIEYTARSIMLHISIDRGQIEAYGLSEVATSLLVAIARWEVRALLDDGLRLRTACEFEPVDEESDTAGLASTVDLAAQIGDLIDGDIPELAGLSVPPLTVRWSSDKKKRSR